MSELVLILKYHNLFINSYPKATSQQIWSQSALKQISQPRTNPASQPHTRFSSYINLSKSTYALNHNTLKV